MIFGDPFPGPFDLGAPTVQTATYSISGEMLTTGKKTYTCSARIQAIITKNYRMGGRVGIESPSYQMAGYIVLASDDPRLTSSIVDAFWWCYGKQYNSVYQSIDMMRYRQKLDYASDGDLDDYWGKVLNVRKRSGESYTDYRSRLATHIRIITSSGTKPNIEAIVDRIIGITGGTNCETIGFGTIRLQWNSLDAIIAAEAADAMITEAMDRTVACGISWSTAYPYATYNMMLYRSYETTTGYDMTSAISKLRGYNYHMTGGIWEHGDSTYDMEGTVGAVHSAIYKQIGNILATGLATYLMAGRMVALTGFSHTDTYSMGGYTQDVITRSYMMTGTVS